ncbi:MULTISPECIES: hypothetical protein [Streptomyces]|uniref:Uncharacterized protein n=1 Tax=Streptomyces tsukubensis (strain DSM 42081 / NBRC 108919 / NRRL 18488 / 9993) TaxID=1114943 RepID=I2MYU2_STRT9|nr:MULTISPECIES: hypothetical protein [Streptomyces]AZK94232.1 hypothetical protein B7R87_10415 [Streptomyces tsukubensis]EIF89939.1 hypothetical protein [Streptomyces tsukubensis NRRL18488]MYS68018.1 hypothetical protein [Streptomyces sp. SID5473]QKM69668.1 hypothetical protein STSU_023380 [Streptomyces tsukubensis NRRL18488]TAI46367.1 hypothetical protein EWI31_04775 [Streptomyces tsukubensis]
MTGGPDSVPGPPPEYCVYCDRPVEPTSENLVMLGFSASGARPSLYAHPECPAPRKIPQRTGH